MRSLHCFLTLCSLLNCSLFVQSLDINKLLTTQNLFAINKKLSAPLVESISHGVQMAMITCKDVFKWDRWNCPATAFNERTNFIPTKEIAYSKAIVAAGIVYQITKNCSRGDLTECGCDTTHAKTWRNEKQSILIATTNATKKMTVQWSWGGCSDDPKFAMSVTKNFLSLLEKGSDVHAYVTKHNHLVGHEIIRNSMVKKCRCHGISGSCSMQTCWMQITPFSEVAHQLKKKYNKAVQISFQHLQGAIVVGNSVRRVLSDKDLHIDPKSLVYLEKSPNYCFANETTGISGTIGRQCSKTVTKTTSKEEKDSCKNLCRSCGHSLKKQRIKQKRRCNCKFKWCCEVQCDICVDNLDDYHCN